MVSFSYCFICFLYLKKGFFNLLNSISHLRVFRSLKSKLFKNLLPRLQQPRAVRLCSANEGILKLQ
ncbi:hypothetical protein DYL61_19100 [Pseudomonas nabeulensis]|uniref:Uncharacterized protein n=1 Tax=Pseudomonas nabeulensis TaxID=2293833 RepID=A0A4Z0AYK5_9PSED|nr:hypothetical protein DYL61_19100 [Pseudomonas nabeulensis]